ncbi:MAG: tRNA pseudouridine(55) synthase TruB [Dissulfurispiraceae bacterium]
MNIVVNVYKDCGVTSHDVVTTVKRYFQVRKAGHAGTLDPIATGVLLVFLNEATKIARFLSDMDKEYILTAKLGERTDTYDTEGRILQRVTDFTIDRKEICEAIKHFVGEIEQIPPMHSAVKVSGKPLYVFARKGIEVERKPRKVTIRSIELLDISPPFVTLRVSCSKGTYMRSLCNDIGNALGVGAHITKLVRTRIGSFTIENASSTDELVHKSQALYSIDSALGHFPEVLLNADDFVRARNGNPLSYPSLWLTNKIEEEPENMSQKRKFVKLKGPDGKLLGIGRISEELIKIERLLKI